MDYQLKKYSQKVQRPLIRFTSYLGSFYLGLAANGFISGFTMAIILIIQAIMTPPEKRGMFIPVPFTISGWLKYLFRTAFWDLSLETLIELATDNKGMPVNALTAILIFLSFYIFSKFSKNTRHICYFLFLLAPIAFFMHGMLYYQIYRDWHYSPERIMLTYLLALLNPFLLIWLFYKVKQDRAAT